jgi:3-oxoacyl-[acyl-carrier protein] reductase
MDLGLAGRVALVTGSYRGTGRGIARVLAREGATVLVHGFAREPAEALASELRGQGHAAHAVSGDVRTDSGALALCEAAVAEAGRVDVVVNNYGVAEGPGWFDGSSEDWLDSYHENVLSGVRVVRGLVPAMRERGWGRVLFVSTVGASRPNARMPHYYAAKAALVNMGVGLAKELAGSGVTVNTVSPGIIATDEVRESFLRLAERRGWDADWEEVQRRVAREVMPTPSGRLGTPEEVGALVAFLASDLAGYVNGSNVRIDGGSADCVHY